MPKSSKTLYSNKVKRKTKRKILNNDCTNRISPLNNVTELAELGEPEEIFRCAESIPQLVQKCDSLSCNEDVNGVYSVDTDIETYNSSFLNKELMDLHINRLFNHLCHSDEIISLLPNRSWAIHCAEVPIKRIVVAQLILHNLHGRGFAPFYVKQIIFDETLNFELFLLNSRTVMKEKLPFIRSLAELQSILEYIECIKLCLGGPDFSEYSKVNLECAYKDQFNKWRHNLCTLEVTDSDICESCMSLEEILKRHTQRINSPLKSRNCVIVTKRRKKG